jgi:hypothetical protein
MSWYNWLMNERDDMDRVLTYCVPNSILCAWTWGAVKKDQVRLVVQKIDAVKDIDHVQAEALIEGKWTPLTELWNASAGKMEIVPWQRHFPEEPYRYLTLREWIDEQIKFTAPPIQL